LKGFGVLFQIEMKQILRSRIFLVSIVMIPFIMLFIFSFDPGNFFLKNVKVVFYNSDPSPLSALFIKFVSSFFKGENFKLMEDKNKMEEELSQGNIDGVIVIPKGFADAILKGKKIDLEYIPSVKNLHTSIYVYRVLKSILEEFAYVVFVRNPKVMEEFTQSPQHPIPGLKVVGIAERNFNYPALMVPGLTGLLALLTIMIGVGTTMTREKEKGTLDVLIMSSISSVSLILAKILVHTVIGIFETIILLMGGRFLLHVNIRNPLLILSLMVLGILSYAGVGILISLLSRSSEVSLTVIASLTFLMIMGSGVFFPIENMPYHFGELMTLIPLTRVVMALRRIVILGYGIREIIHSVEYLGAFSVVSTMLGIWIFKVKYR